jgi:hypothetical protein
MKIKSNVKAGINDPPSGYNHNQSAVRALKVRDGLRADE